MGFLWFEYTPELLLSCEPEKIFMNKLHVSYCIEFVIDHQAK
jgi:hypothetical protein